MFVFHFFLVVLLAVALKFCPFDLVKLHVSPLGKEK